MIKKYVMQVGVRAALAALIALVVFVFTFSFMLSVICGIVTLFVGGKPANLIAGMLSDSAAGDKKSSGA